MCAKLLKVSLGILAALAVSTANSRAGSANYDLNTAPTTEFSLVGSAEWRQTGGVNDSGHIMLIDATGQSCAVLFPDFEPGFVVAAFNFKCKIKCGDWYANPPADGFSVNLAAADDPIIAVIDGGENPGRGGRSDGWAGSQDNGGGEANLPEEGTQTGIGIGFDTWGTGTAPVGGANGPQDLRGISVRVNGKQFAQVAMPNVLFPDDYDFANDSTTLITGPFTGGPNPDNPNVGHPDFGPPAQGTKLKWVELEVDVKADGTLNVFWKGTRIVADLQTPYAPGPARIVFGASTGGAMQYTGIDDIRITTVPAECITPGPVAARVDGFSITVSDSGQSVLDPASVKLKLDGSDVSVTSSSKTGGLTTLRYDLPGGALFDSGSGHTVQLSGKDTRGLAACDFSATRTFTAPAYGTLPADLRVTGVDETKIGFRVRTHQVDTGQPNTNARTEQQLAGELGPNIAGGDDYIDEPGVVNYLDSGGVGNFADDAVFPGAVTGDNMAMEVLAYLKFPTAGIYELGVNSDDGFTVSVGKDFRDRFNKGTLLGEFNGGRGPGDTTFRFRVLEAGYYYFRLTWEEGGGGASCEWFSVLPDGTKVLINDPLNADSIKAFSQGPTSGPAYVKSVRPGVGVSASLATASKIEVVLEDADTKVDKNSVKMKVDGADVSPSVDKVGGTTTVSYNVPNVAVKTYAVELSFSHAASPAQTRTINFSFSIKPTPADLPADTFWVEAEDYDYEGGKDVAAASTMPYAGGAYDGLAATFNVDYRNNDGNDSDLYRPDTAPINVNMNDNLGGRWGSERPGGNTVSVNFKIGWVEDGSWQNYTRTIPTGLYKAYAALSFDGTAAGQLRGSLDKVTAGVGTTSQTVERLTDFNAPGSGGWGPNDLVPGRGGDGSATVMKLGGKTTLRFNLGSGDFDYFLLTPVTGVAPGIKSVSPGGGAVANLNAKVEVQLEDFSTAVVTSSVKLELNGQDVTAQANIAKVADITTISYTPPALFTPGSAQSYKVTWSDNGTPVKTQDTTVNFTAYPAGGAGTILIEAEDFNYSDDGVTGGKTNPKKGTAGQDVDVMPYVNGAYAGLDAVLGVDYNNNDGNDSQSYRQPLTQNGGHNVNMNENLGGRLGRDRGTFQVTSNHKIGWVGDTDWCNYTRTIPAGNYAVWAALSFDGVDPGQCHGTLQMVTSDPTRPNQTVVQLGEFDGPGTARLGGWGGNDLLQLKVSGTPTVLSLGGTQTLRFTMASGDYDYFLLVPSLIQPKPKFTGITRNATTGEITVEWTGGGTLEAAASLAGPWQPVTNVSPYKFTPNPAQPMLFGRIKL